MSALVYSLAVGAFALAVTELLRLDTVAVVIGLAIGWLGREFGSELHQ